VAPVSMERMAGGCVPCKEGLPWVTVCSTGSLARSAFGPWRSRSASKRYATKILENYHRRAVTNT
jgi:hypothetical protein